MAQSVVWTAEAKRLSLAARHSSLSGANANVFGLREAVRAAPFQETLPSEGRLRSFRITEHTRISTFVYFGSRLIFDLSLVHGGA